MATEPVIPRKRSLGLYVCGIMLVGAAVAGTLYYVRAGTEAVAAARTNQASEAARGPRVIVSTVAKGPEFRTITLLGDAKPYVMATLFAKVSGYLKSVSVDKGDSVAAGQVI